MYKRWNVKKVALWIFFIMQISLVILYWVTNENTSENAHNLNSPVAFISKTSSNTTRNKSRYFKENSRVILRTRNVDELFEDFNTSLCYKSGTDIKLMKRSRDTNWKCLCLEGWHGLDCGQPEVIWRALLASRKRPISPTPRRSQRRLIYFCEINAATTAFSEVSLYELRDIADLFIICDLSNSSTELETRLQTGYLSDITHKILYLTGANRNDIWRKATKIIRNLKDEDIFFINNPYEVANGRALQFLKLYDSWPEPLTFRLRWSVYGFFWKHPRRTRLTSGVCTLKYLYEALDNDVDLLKQISIKQQGFIIGDLNHFGGWLCELCTEPALIISSLELHLVDRSLLGQGQINKKVDVAYVEELIENGVHLDGQTQLVRAHRNAELYYAPSVVRNNSWKYDWLLINLYSKMDYY